MPSIRELFARPLSKPALGLFCFGYGLSVFHIFLSVALWAYVPFFTAFFQVHFMDATTVLLFSLNLTLAFTLILDYNIKQHTDKNNT